MPRRAARLAGAAWAVPCGTVSLALLCGLPVAGCAASRASERPTPVAAPTAPQPLQRPHAPRVGADAPRGDLAVLVVHVEARMRALGATCERGGEHGVALTCTVAAPTPRLVFVASSAAHVDPIVHAIYTTRIDGAVPDCEVLGFGAAAFDYLCSDGWPAVLELALYDALTADPPPLSPDRVAERATAVLTSFGVDLSSVPDSVESLLAALPHEAAEGSPAYTPIATALALGTLLGDDVRRVASRFRWVDAADSLTRYYGLRDPDTGEVLRPVEFVIQLLRAPMPGFAAAYRELAAPPPDRRH